MYQPFFNLKEPPFAITPDPRFLFLGEKHRAALAHLLYGIRGSSGFILLTGEVGTGKTTLSRCLIEQVPGSVEIALILNPTLSPLELLASLCDDMGIDYPESATFKTLFDLLNRRLLENYAASKTTVLILDEVQKISVEALEQVRLLSNLETNQRKLLHIILLGQPELIPMLARPELRPFSQRITARHHIAPLTAAETRAFVRYRLTVAGASQAIFGMGALWVIHRASQGIPRLINQMCDRALLGACLSGSRRVTVRIARAAIQEVMGPAHRHERRRTARPVLMVLILLGLWMASLSFFQTVAVPWVGHDAWVVSLQTVFQSVIEKGTRRWASLRQEFRAPGNEATPALDERREEGFPEIPLFVQSMQPAPAIHTPQGGAAPRYQRRFNAQVIDVVDGCHLEVREEGGAEGGGLMGGG